MERAGGSSDVRWKTIPQTSGCDRKRSVAIIARSVDHRPNLQHLGTEGLLETVGFKKTT